MTEYTFTLNYSVPGNAALNDLVERLGESGLTDALPGIGVSGRLGLEFTRDAASAREAIHSAIKDVAQCLPEAILTEACPDFVGLTDIAEIIGCTRQAVRKAMTSNPAFPAPVHDGSTAIWHLSDVLEWFAYRRSTDLDMAVVDVAKITRHVNAELEAGKILGIRARRIPLEELLEGADQLIKLTSDVQREKGSFLVGAEIC